MNRISLLFFKSSAFLKDALLIALVFLAASFFGGIGKISMYNIQVLILACFFFYQVNLCFSKPKPSFLTYPEMRGPFIIFSFFILYVLIQWLGSLHVSKIMPGSIARYRTLDFVYQLICYVLFFFVCLDFFSTRKRVRFFTIMVGIIVILLAALGYYQEYSQAHRFVKMYGAYPLLPDATQMFYSSFYNQNHYGGFLVLTSLLFFSSVLYFIETYERPEKEFRFNFTLVSNIFFLSFLPLIMASIFDAAARAAMIVELLILFAFALIGPSPKHRLKVLVTYSVVVLGFFLFLLVSNKDNFTRFFVQFFDVLMYRATVSKELSAIFFDFPFFGTGLGTTMYISTLYQKLDAGLIYFVYMINYNLQLLCETGLIGYLLFVGPLAFVVIGSLKRCLKGPSRWCRIYGIGSFLAIVAIEIFSLMDDYLRTPAVALFFIAYLAILIKCSHLDIENDDIQEPEETSDAAGTPIQIGEPAKKEVKFAMSIPRIAFWLILTLLLLILFRHGRHSAMELHLRYLANGDPAIFERAVLARSEDPRVWARLGTAYFDEAEKSSPKNFEPNIKASIKAYETAITLTPTWSRGWFLLGRARIFSGDKWKGLQNIVHGVELAPHDRNGYLYLILAYLKEAESSFPSQESREFTRAAIAWLDKASRLPRPLTKDDHDYICNERIMWPDRCLRISGDDHKRFLYLLKESSLLSEGVR